MGTFQVTYDDFSGGHYMGNRAASLPKNTWYGTNTVLNGKGELIPGGVGEIGVSNKVLAGTFVSSDSSIPFGFTYYGDNYFVVTEAAVTTPPIVQQTRLLRVEGGYGNTAPVFTSYTLSGIATGNCTTANDFATTGQQTLFYVDSATGNVRKVTLPIWGPVTDTVLSTGLSTVAVDSIVAYKYRLVVWCRNTGSTESHKIFYSDPTKSTFSTADYYEFPSAVQKCIPRANDLLVIASDGVYSVTGVFGSSVNIQLLTPANELFNGMRDAKASGRSVFFLAADRNEYPYDPRIYQFLGSTSTEIGRIDIQDYADATSDETTFNLARGGDLMIWLSNGAFYVQKAGGPFYRFILTRPQNFSPMPQACLAEPIDAFTVSDQEQGRVTGACFNSAGGVVIQQFGWGNSYPGQIYEAFPYGTPKSASVQLSEYWHSKPFVVRDLLVEAVYDTNFRTGLVGNMIVQAQIIPTGTIDFTVNQTPALTSSTQNYTTTDSTVLNNNSRVLHRFRVDNAIRGYGFYPQITFQGCRIRRVIAICED